MAGYATGAGRSRVAEAIVGNRPGLGLLLLGFSLLMSARLGFGQELSRFTYSEPVMGTEFRILIYGQDGARTAAAAATAMQRAREIDSLLSDWRSDSELSRLSRLSGADTCAPVSHDLLSVLEHAQGVAERSEGAFDVTIGPMSRLWRWAMRRGQLPAESRLAAAHAAVGYQKLVVDAAGRCVRLTVPDMSLDLGGIAKGYAADEMLRTLDALGFPAALIDAGGDIVAGEIPPDAQGWLVETRSVDDLGISEARDLHLSNAAVATSGDRHRYLVANGIRYSHLLDPRTGFGLTRRRHVTVVSPSGMEADALASAISVMGEGGLFLADRPGCGARLLEYGAEGTQIFEVGLLKE